MAAPSGSGLAAPPPPSPCGGDVGAPDPDEGLPHPLQSRPKLLSCVRLLKTAEFFRLPAPLPRSQDLPEASFGAVRPEAQVISVSHAWRNQVHPDPTGAKARALAEELRRLPEGLLFLDFVSIPQRPWRRGMAQRTESEEDRFREAVRCMHEMYFYSNYVVHLPWEESEVEGEGEERMLPAAALQGCSFKQVQESVQVAVESATAAVGAFDVVVSVDEAPVRSVGELERMLRAGGRLAVLRRLPYGLPNALSADQRGWVFLERFITMVKCAMMEQEAARAVVVTSSESIREQIFAGAAQLRWAAQKGSGELERVLQDFLMDLEEKQFSATSTDKQADLLAKESQGSADREAVVGIMQEFVTHLGENWEEEVAVQRGLAAKMAVAAKELLVKWPAFSEGYAERLEEAGVGWGMGQLACLALSPCLILALLLVPVESPVLDADMKAAPMFFLVVCPCGFLLAMTVFPSYIFLTFQVPVSRQALVSLAIWLGIYVLAYFFTATALTEMGLKPVPLQPCLTWLMSLLLLPLLWLLWPKASRSPELWQKFVLGYVWLWGCFTSTGFILPVVNAHLPFINRGLQAVLLLTYLVVKILMELLSVFISKRLGADITPNLVFHITMFHETLVCVTFVQILDPFVVIMQACFNMLENGYHAASLRWLNLTKREEQYLVSSLVTREFVELLVPMQFLLVYIALVKIRPENIAMACNQREEDVARTVLYTLLSLSSDFFVTLVTFCWLRSRGHTPLALLRGLWVTRPFFGAIGVSAWAYNLLIQHSHLFNDLSGSFPWWREGAEWVCGYVWEPTA